MSAEYRARVRAALKNSRPSSRNLSAFALDISYYLEQTGLFSRVRVKKTGEPEGALLVTCQVSDPAAPRSIVLQVLERVWQEAPLAYGGQYDAYELSEEPDGVQMEFVTVAAEGFGVTGRIAVRDFTGSSIEETK